MFGIDDFLIWAGVGMLAGAAIVITISFLRDKLQEWAVRHRIKAAFFEIKRKWRNGDYSEVSVGLLDHNMRQRGRNVHIREEGGIADEVEEGAIYSLYD